MVIRSFVRYRSTATDTETEQEATTQGVQKASAAQCSNDSHQSMISSTLDREMIFVESNVSCELLEKSGGGGG